MKQITPRLSGWKQRIYCLAVSVCQESRSILAGGLWLRAAIQAVGRSYTVISRPDSFKFPHAAVGSSQKIHFQVHHMGLSTGLPRGFFKRKDSKESGREPPRQKPPSDVPSCLSYFLHQEKVQPTQNGGGGYYIRSGMLESRDHWGPS